MDDVIQFTWDVECDEGQWRVLFEGRYSEPVGIQAEMAFRNASRGRIWFPGDATPTCFACISGAARQYSSGSPD